MNQKWLSALCFWGLFVYKKTPAKATYFDVRSDFLYIERASPSLPASKEGAAALLFAVCVPPIIFIFGQPLHGINAKKHITRNSLYKRHPYLFLFMHSFLTAVIQFALFYLIDRIKSTYLPFLLKLIKLLLLVILPSPLVHWSYDALKKASICRPQITFLGLLGSYLQLIIPVLLYRNLTNR